MCGVNDTNDIAHNEAEQKGTNDVYADKICTKFKLSEKHLMPFVDSHSSEYGSISDMCGHVSV